ncbi:polymer-forming cytoskeletal protein, partial [Breznakia sp. OttesenSCG-928-G09]|nr:polymer-forming cytoskeletal protein [Breznakia sp. OttesenSCG-928-G09]
MDNNYEGNEAVEATVFAKGLVIEGDVQVDSPLMVNGVVNGNITSNNHVELDEEASVKGDIRAMQLHVNSGKVEGDIHTDGQLYIGKDTYVKGSIIAGSVIVEGNIDGNIQVEGNIRLLNSAKVLGSIHTAEIEIDRGAKLSGNVQIKDVVEEPHQDIESEHIHV